MVQISCRRRLHPTQGLAVLWSLTAVSKSRWPTPRPRADPERPRLVARLQRRHERASSRQGRSISMASGLLDAHNPEQTVVIELVDERYDELIIEVADPASAVSLLQGSLR